MVENLNEPKQYVSVSTRLPSIDANLLNFICEKQNITPSEYIRDLVQRNLNSPKRNFLSGKNRVKYDKTTNSFSWIVELDSGKESEVLSSLSDDFLKNLQEEIKNAIKERNQWVHQTKSDSISIPDKLIEGNI